jgi:hypothetical protein
VDDNKEEPRPPSTELSSDISDDLLRRRQFFRKLALAVGGTGMAVFSTNPAAACAPEFWCTPPYTCPARFVCWDTYGYCQCCHGIEGWAYAAPPRDAPPKP